MKIKCLDYFLPYAYPNKGKVEKQKIEMKTNDGGMGRIYIYIYIYIYIKREREKPVRVVENLCMRRFGS